MLKLTEEEKDLVVDLGLRLRKARIAREMTQAELATRAGLSRQTIVNMEQGDPAVGLGKWLKAASLLGVAETWGTLFELPPDPFAEYDRQMDEEEKLRKTRVRPK